MKLLLDTHMLIWALSDTLPRKAKHFIADETNSLYFSPISIWEIVIKHKSSRTGFLIEPPVIHAHLLNDGYQELPFTSTQALLVKDLPPIHKDPFDHILIAQAKAAGMLLLTADKTINKYNAPVLYCPKK
jgi:PIN domain nuclease of toxin-antitoxin system